MITQDGHPFHHGPAFHHGPTFRARLAGALPLLLGAALLSGCDPVTEPEPQLSFKVLSEEETRKIEGPRVEGGDGRITLTAVIPTPDPCQEIGARAEGDGTLTITVTATSEEVACIQVIWGFGYRAILSDLEPGPHVLRLVHDYRKTGWATDTVLVTTVRVD